MPNQVIEGPVRADHAKSLHAQHQDQWQEQQLRPAEREDSDSSTISEHESSQQDGLARAGHADQNDKSRVGPMGIFFKVWSLVKVTKSRHNRMKRQASDAAQQQFQYISGEQFKSAAQQLAGPSPTLTLPRGSFNQPPQGQRHLLLDSHFRRAGSQPPISSHAERRHLEPTTNGIQSTATGTSSSSGVSSTTSSTLATNYTLAADVSQPGATGQKGDRFRTAGSRSSWAPRNERNSLAAAPLSSAAQPQAAPSTSPSRYRATRSALDKRPSMQPLVCSTANGQSAAEAKRQSRAQSEAKQIEELKRKAISAARGGSPAALTGSRSKSKMSLAHFRSRPRRDSVSDDGAEYGDDDDDDDDEGEEDRPSSRSLRTSQRRLEADEEEDSDLNDIYSTPNDSIQSVPSGQLMFESSQRRTSANGAPAPSQIKRQGAPPKPDEPPNDDRKSNQGSYRMTKSFSANYFNKLTESEPSREKAKRSVTERVGSTIMENGETSRPAASGTRPNGSRFFISSSSSEDSNPPAQAQSASTLTAADTNNGRSSRNHFASNEPHKDVRQIPIQSALHYHGPRAPASAASRPNSLAVAAPSQLLLLQTPQTSILTPNTFVLNGSSFEPSLNANVAAMSPMMCDLTNTANFQRNINGIALAANKLPNCQLVNSSVPASHYKKSPSLFEIGASGGPNLPANMMQRFSSKYPWASRSNQARPMSSFVGAAQTEATKQSVTNDKRAGKFFVPNSVSLHDCKLTSAAKFENDENRIAQRADGDYRANRQLKSDRSDSSEYRLAQMLLELGSNPTAKDESGCTALMHSIMSENLPAFKCLIERGVDLDDTNHSGQSALDLICSGTANETLLEMLKIMIQNEADLDQVSKEDGSRLLDRLINEHHLPNIDKTPFIDCLLHNGAKLGSSTWLAARDKLEIQLKLLKKLCQDGYFLYKKSSIEAAVFRFEYALKRVDELEQQIHSQCRQSCSAKNHGLALDPSQQQAIIKETQQAKYQTFLGLSRCERKRGFYKRALEFANMSILIDSTSYEGYYSKAHILKDIGEREDALSTIDQTERLVSKTIEMIKTELDIQEESIMFDGCFNMHDPHKSSWTETNRLELQNNLVYLIEAKRHIVRLKEEIINDKKP